MFSPGDETISSGRAVIREELMDRTDCLRRAESERRSASNFTAMTNDLRMLRRCLIGCHLRAGSAQKGEKWFWSARWKARDGKGWMMMRAKLIIPADVNDYEAFFLLSFSPCRGATRFLNFDEALEPRGDVKSIRGFVLC